jgi:hypothetical protein
MVNAVRRKRGQHGKRWERLEEVTLAVAGKSFPTRLLYR